MLQCCFTACTALLPRTLEEGQGREVLIWTVSLVPSTSATSENIPDGLLCALWSESSSHQTYLLILDQSLFS